MDLIILRPEGLKGINSIHKQLSKAILLEFAGPDNFGTKKQNKKGEGFVGNFKSEKGKHWISGLDREKVCGLPWVGYVVPVLDGFSLVGRERAPPLDVI